MSMRAIVMFLWALLATGEVIAGQSDGGKIVSIRDCPDCPERVSVPAGEFVMGAEIEEPRRLALTEFWATREQPRHRVRIKNAFALGKYELTRLSEQGDSYSKWLNSPYKGILNGN